MFTGVHVGSTWKCERGMSDSEGTYEVSVCGCLWVGMCRGDTCREYTHGERCEVGVFMREACVRDEWGDLDI